MSDLVSAASLLLAVLGVLYGLWYPEIIEALDIKVPAFREDRNKPIQQVVSVLYGRAIPLAVAALGVSLIFLPDALEITRRSIQNYLGKGFEALTNYNAVQTSFCFVVTLSGAIAMHITYFSVKLVLLRRRLLGKHIKTEKIRSKTGDIGKVE